MHRRSFFSPLAFGAASAATLAALAIACGTTTTTTTFTPITGVIIRSDTLVQGVGCGTGAGQVYKYAAFVGPSGQPMQYEAAFDCFADGVFLNLSASSTQSYDVQILAFNQATWAKVENDLDNTKNDAGSGQLDPAFATRLHDDHVALANWTTTCTATEQQQIQVLAVCQPLVAQSTAADAGVGDAGADAPPDATADARADSAPDAPAADAPSDAPADAPAEAAPTDAAGEGG